MTATPPDGPSADMVALEHLYATMYCLLLLAEVGGAGAAARVACTGQGELWPAIAHLGGNQQAFTEWRMRREEAVSGRGRYG